MKKLIKALPIGTLSIIAIAIISYLSLDTTPFGKENIQLFPGVDKIVHVLMYFFTACMFELDYAKFRLPHHTKADIELLCACFAMLFGFVLEIIQLRFIDARMFESWDIVANCVGAVLGFFYLRLWGMHKFRRMMLHSNHHHHRH